MKVRANAVLLSVAVSGVLSLASAAEKAGDAKDRFALGEVVVTARARDNSMIGGDVIEQEKLRTFNKLTVDSALDLVPGAAASTTGGSRNERLVFIRGFDRFQATLSIDGVRVFLPADNRIDFARFLTADLSAIQISKGYVSVLDGPGGIGGAINLVTRKPAAELEAEAVLNGSFDNDLESSGYTVSGRIGTRQEKFYVQLSGTQSDVDHWSLSDDYSPTTLEDGGERNNSDSDDYRANIKIGFVPNATDEYALNYTKQAGEKNAPYHVTDTASTRFWAWPYWDIDSLYFLSNTQLTTNSYLRTRAYINSFENALFSYDDAAQSVQSLPRAFRSYYDDRAYGARVEYGIEFAGVNTLRASLHYRSDEHTEWQDGFVRVPATGSPFSNVAYSEPKQTTKEATYSIALEDTQAIGSSLDLVVGMSYDWTDLKRAEDLSLFVTGSTINRLPVNYPLKNASAINGQAALSYTISDSLKTHVSVSSRARFPTLFERFSSRFGTAVPNPDIKEERATNFEIGGDLRVADNIRIDAAIFYSDVSDALISVPVVFGAPISATLNQTRNVGDGNYFGIETSMDARIPDALSVSGNYTYINREFTDPTNAAFRSTGVPTHKLFATADWRVGGNVSIVPSVEWNSDRWTVTSSSTIVPPRYYRTGSSTQINLSASWAANERFDILAGARNLTDRNYQLVDGFPEQGRNYYVSVRARY